MVWINFSYLPKSADLAPIREPQYVEHIVRAGALGLPPKGGFQGAAGEYAAVCGDVAQGDPLAGGKKHHVMLADNIATAHNGKTDIAAFAGAGDAIACRIAHLLEVNAAPVGGRFAQHQRGARWRIYFVMVVRLDHFDVKVFVQCCRDLFGKLRQQVDPQRHIPGAHDHGMARGAAERLKVFIGEPGCANHMDRFCLGCQL